MEQDSIEKDYGHYLKPNINKYYVYLHRDAASNVILVGKGTGPRYRGKAGRPAKWKNLVKTYQIVKSGLTEQDALLLEKQLTSFYKTPHLLNISKGHKSLPLELINEYVKYSEESPTFLVWKKCSTRGKGALTGVVGGTAGSVVIAGKENYDKTCMITINKVRNLSVHRIIWLMHHGDKDMDTKIVDHIDGNPLNNNINNLRLVNASVNQKNRKSKNNTGHVGIIWRESLGGYRLRVTLNDGTLTKFFSLVRYENKELALSAAINYKIKNKRSLLESGYSERYIYGDS